MIELQEFKWIRESCERQNATTPEDFIGMASAYVTIRFLYDARLIEILNERFIIDLARLINNDSDLSFRYTPVTFNDGTFGSNATDIPRQIDLLFGAFLDGRCTSEELYQRFEEIHPFTDGNGRLGALLYNFCKGTLAEPIHPPEFITR